MPFDVYSQAGADAKFLTEVDGGDADAALAAIVDLSTGSEFSRTLAGKFEGLPYAPCPVIDLAETDDSTEVRPLESIGGYLYGYTGGSTMARSATVGGPRTAVYTFPSGGRLTAIRELGDGEVLVTQSGGDVYRSAGWATNPLTASWSKVLTTNAYIAQYGITVDDEIGWVLVTNYVTGADMSLSRYLWLSEDHGQTFRVIYDSEVAHPEVNPLYSHMHTAIVDKHSPNGRRVWLSWHKTSADPTVDSPRRCIITYSDNVEGNTSPTWTDYSTDDIHPVVMAATPEGIVHDTDSVAFGASLMLIDRRTMATRRLYRRRTTVDAVQLWSWGARAIKGTEPNTWHILWRGVDPGAPAGVTTTDGRRVSETMTIPAVSSADIVDAFDLMVHQGELVATYTQTATASSKRNTAVGAEPRRGDPGNNNAGGILGGIAADQAVAVGLNANADASRATAVGQISTAARDGVAVGWAANNTALYSVAVGRSATSGLDTVAIGYNANNGGTGAIAIGSGATGVSRTTAIGYAATAGGDSVAVGWTAKGGTNSVSVGREAGSGGVEGQGGGSNYVAIGYKSRAASSSVAIGANATVTGGSGSMAIGLSATANNVDAVAIGANTSTSHTLQVAIGPRHLEQDVLAAEPGIPAVGKARIYAIVGATGATELVARFTGSAGRVPLASSAAVHVLPGHANAARPSATAAGPGGMFWSTTLNKPLWSNGTAWVDATGATA